MKVVKKVLYYIAIIIFWVSVAATFAVGCFGTFFENTDNQTEDYEEHVHSNVP